jgi:hypothetical protein
MKNPEARRNDSGRRPAYLLGHSDRELERLRVQARFIEPITRRFFVDAGIAPGMRVLDVGSGVGDVAIPDAYRQECSAGQAEDTAWVVATGGSVTVPYGKVRNTLTTLESTRLEPGSYDEKIYGPGIGIVIERSLTGNEVAQLISVSG